MDEFMKQIALLKPMLLVALIGTILITIVGVILCRYFSWNGKNMHIIGFFYECSTRDCIVLAVCLAKFYLVLSLLCSRGRIGWIHIIMLGMLVVLQNIINCKLKEAAVSLFNGFVMMVVLYVTNFLLAYLRDVLFDIRIAIAIGLLAVFLVLYALYDIASSILCIVEKRKRVDEDN